MKLPKILQCALDAVADRLGYTPRHPNVQPLPTFANTPKNFVIKAPWEISNAKHIHVGDDVRIGSNSVLRTTTHYPGLWMSSDLYPSIQQTFAPTLRIGNRVTATGSLQVNALAEIVIEDDVMFATNVLVCDAMHGYDSTDIPYKYQPMSNLSPIRIGRGCWIGQNVVILPGVRIGEMSIIGANSVVTRSIPPRTIAVGSPAKAIKNWDDARHSWKPIDEPNVITQAELQTAHLG
jgi:acetyltransferase-like isoleucine patch superfamily enzyme